MSQLKGVIETMPKTEQGTAKNTSEAALRQAMLKDFIEKQLSEQSKSAISKADNLTIRKIYDSLKDKFQSEFKSQFCVATIGRDIIKIGFDTKKRRFSQNTGPDTIDEKRREIIDFHSVLLSNAIRSESYTPIDWLTLKVEPGHEEGVLTSLKKVFPTMMIGGCTSRGGVLVACVKSRLPDLQKKIQLLLSQEPGPNQNTTP